MPLAYGVDVHTPTTQRGDDPWKPVMLNAVRRVLFQTPEGLLQFLDNLKAGNACLVTRVVEVQDDETVYSL